MLFCVVEGDWINFFRFGVGISDVWIGNWVFDIVSRLNDRFLNGLFFNGDFSLIVDILFVFIW